MTQELRLQTNYQSQGQTMTPITLEEISAKQAELNDLIEQYRNKPTLPRKEAAATPPEFRDVLISMARSARPTHTPATHPIG